MNWSIRILEHSDELSAIEELQRLIWPGSETDVVPAHVFLAAIHNGGLVIAAYADPSQPIGFVFGFPGLYATPDGPRIKHASHMLGVHPDYRSQGVGFALKRAQWQMVRKQDVDRITWTYDPLFSPNAYLNISRLGAVCNTYLKDFYGAMRDDLNAGISSDRFEVDWWVNSRRVNHRLSRRPRKALQIDQFLAAQTLILNPAQFDNDGLPVPPPALLPVPKVDQPMLLVEIPIDFLALKARSMPLAQAWRSQTRIIFENLFARGYLVTDFLHQPGSPSRSYYVLSFGESTL
jgi:predicted GNAT superfamily acetyltransferase